MTLGKLVYGDRLVVFLFFSSSRLFNAKRHTLTHTVPCLQMSGEGRSDKVKSGNAFEGDSLSLLTLVGRQTPDFSWTDSLRWELASHHDNDAEGSSSQRAAKTRLRQPPQVT